MPEYGFSLTCIFPYKRQNRLRTVTICGKSRNQPTSSNYHATICCVYRFCDRTSVFAKIVRKEKANGKDS